MKHNSPDELRGDPYGPSNQEEGGRNNVPAQIFPIASLLLEEARVCLILLAIIAPEHCHMKLIDDIVKSLYCPLEYLHASVKIFVGVRGLRHRRSQGIRNRFHALPK
jgi:hypothetical protein